jgi:hypothetical protein
LSRGLAWPLLSLGRSQRHILDIRIRAELHALHLASPLWGDHTARPKATASGVPLIDGHFRVRHDTIDIEGKLTLRHNRRLHHIGLGRRHAGTPVLVPVHDLHIRVLSTSGRLLRDLILDPGLLGTGQT